MELKPCPMLFASNTPSAYCIGKDCAWWCEAAQKCSIAVLGEEACRRVGEEEKE